jgi:hypothetical protein
LPDPAIPVNQTVNPDGIIPKLIVGLSLAALSGSDRQYRCPTRLASECGYAHWIRKNRYRISIVRNHF